MERLAVCPAVISLLFLISSPSAFAGDQHGFSIKVFTSPDDQFWVNSVIIEGANEVMLVDAQLTKTNAERVLQQIKETKKPLSIIYITHEHADHFLGLEVFKEAYPRVRIIANSAVVDRINKVYQDKIDKWKKILGTGATSHVVVVRTWTTDLKDRHIRSNVVSPGPVNTPLASRQSPDVIARIVSTIPMGRMGEPDEVAKVALFLASDDSSFVTGIELFVDGGRAQI